MECMKDVNLSSLVPSILLCTVYIPGECVKTESRRLLVYMQNLSTAFSLSRDFENRNKYKYRIRAMTMKNTSNVFIDMQIC